MYMAVNDTQSSMIERVGYRIATAVERWMPSPFLFAILLSYIVFLAGVIVTDAGPGAMVGHWYDGFWAFLTFSMQMVLILMTGFALAYHPRINDLLVRLTKLPNGPGQAAVLVGVFAMAIAWIHWGFSLILGAIFAREMGKTAHEADFEVHYPLLAVAGYMGLGLTWHWGLSASAPLMLATEGNAFIEQGVVEGVVPASQTIFHPYGLTLVGLSILFALAVLYVLAPSGIRARGITEYIPESALVETSTDGGTVDAGEQPVAETERGGRPPAAVIDNSRLLGGLIALTGVGVVGYQFVTNGLDALTLNVVNFGFLMAGILVWTNPAAYREKFNEGAKAAAGIILLFPFFAGIQGMMAGSGLAQMMAEGLIAISTEQTFPMFAWLTAAIVNLFVPSGGGEWIILGQPILQAAQDLGIPLGQATMAYAVGDAHTNLLNPFWALPLLAITRIKAREMFGYAVLMLLALIPFLAIVLMVLPY